MQQDDVATYAARLVKEVPVAPGWTSPGDPDTWPERWTNDSLVYAKEAHQDIRLTAYLGPDEAARVPHRWRIEQPAGYGRTAWSLSASSSPREATGWPPS